MADMATICLAGRGMMGHAYFVVGPDSEVDPLGREGWWCRAECCNLESARRTAGPGERIYKRTLDGFRRIPKREPAGA